MHMNCGCFKKVGYLVVNMNKCCNAHNTSNWRFFESNPIYHSDLIWPNSDTLRNKANRNIFSVLVEDFGSNC